VSPTTGLRGQTARWNEKKKLNRHNRKRDQNDKPNRQPGPSEASYQHALFFKNLDNHKENKDTHLLLLALPHIVEEHTALFVVDMSRHLRLIVLSQETPPFIC
jgi:hypothetical protein